MQIKKRVRRILKSSMTPPVVMTLMSIGGLSYDLVELWSVYPKEIIREERQLEEDPQVQEYRELSRYNLADVAEKPETHRRFQTLLQAPQVQKYRQFGEKRRNVVNQNVEAKYGSSFPYSALKGTAAGFGTALSVGIALITYDLSKRRREKKTTEVL